MFPNLRVKIFYLKVRKNCTHIYHLLKEEQTYYELGSTSFDERERDAVKRRALQSLERLGYDVSLQEKGAGA